MRHLFAAVLVLASAGCGRQRLRLGAADDGEVVEAEGWSPLDSDRLAAKQRSLAEAQKKAVERVVGVFISAKTRVAQAVTLNQNILANVGGYVKRYDVVSERVEDGFYKIVIRAHVLYKKVGADLQGLGLVRPESPPGNPRVQVSVSGEAGGEDGPASGAVRRAMLERGFQVIEGKAHGSDLAVSGSATVRELSDARLGGFRSWRARVELSARRGGTGEVLARKTHEASGLDPVGDIARAKALENAGGLAAEELASELSQVLTSRVAVTVKVSGMKGGLAEVQKLAEDLRLQPDVAQVVLVEFGPGGAELKVSTEGFAGDELGTLLQHMKGHRLQMRSVTPYLIEAAVAD